MIQIKEKQDCCGCTACYNICPKNAITMAPDSEGFLYPAVDKEKCVKCSLCERVCPIINKAELDYEKTEGYIFRYNDEKILKESTSGGAFTAFAEYHLSEDYIVYGTGYDADMSVTCKKAERSWELEEMRGSKFVQSNLGKTFWEIRRQIKDGRKILFTGTPCQVSGLISYLGGKPDNLICFDFVCRGVSSPMLWGNYVDMMEKKYGSKMVGARFKNKTYGYHTTTMKVDFANGKTWYGSGRVDPMMKAFVREMSSRPSCHVCAFKGVKRQSDITMFDCYEFSKITGRKDDNRGYSSLLVHTETGKRLIERLNGIATILSCSIMDLVTENGIMVNHSAKPSSFRDGFYQYASNHPIDVAIQEFDPITGKDYLIELLKEVLYKTGLITCVKKMKKEIIDVTDAKIE